MTDYPQGQDYGTTLPDHVEKISEFIDAHLEVINDVREFYVSRVALEREYASKLQSLSRKASEKKIKLQSILGGSGERMKSSDSVAMKQSTLGAAYDEIISSVAKIAQTHVLNADTLSTHAIETLRTLWRRNDDAKKKIISFFQKILSDRDRVFADHVKSKQKYDEDCAEVESLRQKQGRAVDDKHADRAARQADQQRDNMFNSKNCYLISMAIANRIQAKFYKEDIPQLENELQRLQRHLVQRFAKVMLHSQQTELSNLDRHKAQIADLDAKLGEIDIVKDQDLFVNRNIRSFVAPDGWNFEPCSIHYDTALMNTDAAPKIVLQNKLRRSKEKLGELEPLLKSKRAESQQLDLQLSSYQADHGVGAVDDLTDKYLEVGHQVILYSTSQCILETETETIVAAIGGDLGTAKPHAFKSSSFSIPAPCGCCHSMIWGLSKGKTCRACGLSVHPKCELKVAANCEGKSSSTLRQSADATSTDDHTPTPSTFVQSTSPQESVEGHVEAKVLFDFMANSEFELEVREGVTVRILEADDGSGWVKVLDTSGDSGLVPASYLEILSAESPSDSSGERVRAMYPYQGQTPDELDIREGEVLLLAPGGKQYGNGWWEGFNAQGRKGVFPSNYVEYI